MTDKLQQDLEELSDAFKTAFDKLEQEQEAYWNSLSKEDQLKAFCAVVRRIHQAEIVDQGTYRHALYLVLKPMVRRCVWPQMAGYLTIHNQIYSDEYEGKLIAAEREECAKVVESYCGAWDDEGYALAQAIRNRGEK